MGNKKKILICGILPPPNFGHSMMYQMLMHSRFVEEFDVIFLNMGFWTYGKHRRVTMVKILKLVKYYIQFVWLLIVRRPDFVLYNMSFYRMPFFKDVLFCFTAKLLRCKYIIHDMGKYAREMYDGSSKTIKAIVRCYLDWSDSSIIQGESVRQAYDNLMPRGKLWVVPCAVEDTQNVNVPIWDSTNKARVLYFSFLSKEKGVYTAFSAVDQVLAENNNIDFIFAGPVESDEVRTSLDALLKTCPENIQYLGYIDNTEKRTELFRNADMFIFPTQREAFGLVLLHAMAEGVPIIASNEGEISRIVKDQENGFLIEKGNVDQLAEHILRLAGDPSMRAKMKESNRQRFLDRYTSEVYEKNMISTIHNISRS